MQWSKRNNLAQCYSAPNLSKCKAVEFAARIAIATDSIEHTCYSSMVDLRNNHGQSINLSLNNNDNVYPDERVTLCQPCHQETRIINKENFDELLSDIMRPKVKGDHIVSGKAPTDKELDTGRNKEG